MTKNILWMLLCAVLLANGACKSEFEKVRVSGNVDLILKKAFEYYEDKKYQKAQTLFELVMSNIRARPDAEKANFQFAYTHYHLKQFLLAAYYFKNFSDTYVNSPQREEAAYMSAYSNYLQSPSHRLDQGATLTAIEEFQNFANAFPNSLRVDECNRLIDEMRRKLEEKAFKEGELYYNLRQYQSAVISFDNLLKEYPESPDVERVRYLIVRALQQLSDNSVVDKKQERYTETVKRCEEFLGKYVSGKYSKEVREIKKGAESELRQLAKREKDQQKKSKT
jgi:outer membrane protein assembly factor BamD